jgi:hypothetical protein
MAWDKIVTADTVVQRLYEDKGLYQRCNRSYDSLVTQGATSVRRPKLAQLAARKNEGTASTDAARKLAHNDTTMVETTLDVYTVPIANELAAKFESNDRLRSEYEISMAMALKRQFNADVIAAAQATTNVSNFAGASLAWADFGSIFEHFEKKEIPEDGRVIVVSANLTKEFYNIDTIKSAIGFNRELLQSGMANQMLGATWYISGLVPQIGGKDNVVGFYGPGLAFILSAYGEIKEVYDPGVYGVTKPRDVIDMTAHAAAELDDNDFAVVLKKP